MRVTFNELATRELNDAAQYYEQEQAELGASFINEIERCTQEVLSFAILAFHPLRQGRGR